MYPCTHVCMKCQNSMDANEDVKYNKTIQQTVLEKQNNISKAQKLLIKAIVTSSKLDDHESSAVCIICPHTTLDITFLPL